MSHTLYFCATIAFFLVTLLFMSACGKNTTNANPCLIDYTICDDNHLPQEIQSLINQKKENPFFFTYQTNTALYIVKGYGMQHRNELSVTLDSLYLENDTIYISTTLTSQSQNVNSDILTYPYIVVKCNRSNASVICLD